jgi:hypothetical protein
LRNTSYTLEQALVEPVVTTRQNIVSLHRAQSATRLGGKRTNKKLALIAPTSNGALFHNTTTKMNSTRLRARKKGRKWRRNLEGINSFPIIILMKGNGKRKWVVGGARPGLGAG